MKKVVIAVLISMIGAGVFVISMGWFPVARVSGSLMYYSDLDAYMTAAELIRRETGAPSDDAKTDRRRLTLEEMIVRQIIKDSASEFGMSSVEEEVESQLVKILSSVNQDGLKDAAARLYGMDLDEFKERVMMPQIREIVIRNRVDASGKEYDAWLEEKARNAQVSIYFLPYRWNGRGLENK